MTPAKIDSKRLWPMTTIDIAVLILAGMVLCSGILRLLGDSSGSETVLSGVFSVAIAAVLVLQVMFRAHRRRT